MTKKEELLEDLRVEPPKELDEFWVELFKQLDDLKMELPQLRVTKITVVVTIICVSKI